MNKIRIITKNAKTEIFVDDKKIENVRSYKITESVESIPVLQLELIALNIETETIGAIITTEVEGKNGIGDSFYKM